MFARISLVGALGLAGCGFHIGATEIDAGPGGGDARDAADRDAADGAIDGPVDGPPAVGPWGTPVLVVIAGSGADDDPTMTDDRLELYFNRSSDIYMTKRINLTAPWTTPVLVTELSTAANETTPEITGDGLTMYFASDRAGSVSGSGDIWITTRPSRTSPWGAPIVQAALNSDQNESNGTPTDDLSAMVLTSNRDFVDSDLYLATRSATNVAWGTPVRLTTVSTAGDDLSPMLSQDKLQLYWDSYGTGVNDDLFTSSRTTTSAAFAAPTAITELNTASVETDPWVSADGHHMLFVSNRSGAYQLYETSR